MLEIYGKIGCKYCDMAKELLDSKEIPYKYYTMGIDYTVDEYKEKFPGRKTVPGVVNFGMVLGGYEELHDFVEETAGLDDDF